jgi:hypothetical protein
MDNNNKIILTTKIPIKNIINNVIEKQPQNECEFNNLLLFELSTFFFDNFENQQKQILIKGGRKNYKVKKIKKTKKVKKIIKNKTKMKRNNNAVKKLKHSQKGGTDPRIIVFFISLFFIFSKGIKNMTDSDVIKRIKEANNVSILFKNDYGTCALNSLLFLKTIDLPTFEQLSIGIIKDQISINRFDTGTYLNREIHIYSKWYSISEKTEEKNLRIGLETVIENYIDKIKIRLIELRKFYNFPESQSIITEMNFPFKNTSEIAHSVVIWLTSENDLVLIDPQKFLKNELVIFTNNPNTQNSMFRDQMLNSKSLKDYIKEYVDLYEYSFIFESLHIELEDLKGENKLEQENINLQKTILRIQETKDKKENRKLTRVEEL